MDKRGLIAGHFIPEVGREIDRRPERIFHIIAPWHAEKDRIVLTNGNGAGFQREFREFGYIEAVPKHFRQAAAAAVHIEREVVPARIKHLQGKLFRSGHIIPVIGPVVYGIIRIDGCYLQVDFVPGTIIFLMAHRRLLPGLIDPYILIHGITDTPVVIHIYADPFHTIKRPAHPVVRVTV